MRDRQMNFTHFDEAGNAIMVDVGQKEETHRYAVAHGKITMTKTCYDMVKQGSHKKGDVLNVARVAGIMAVKKTAEWIPLCHNIFITKAEIDFEWQDENKEIIALCTVHTYGQTGVEMEALTGVSVALLTIYDMCKSVDRSMEIGDIYLLEKDGGKSGRFQHQKKDTHEGSI